METTRTFRTWLSVCLVIGVLVSCSKDNEKEPKPKETQLDIAIVDNAVQVYMAKYNVPGLSLAVTKGEKLVYVKAYGKANRETGEDVKPTSLFRLASVSKSITGVAIMKLVDDNRLALDDKVFGPGALLGTTYGTKAYTGNLQNITVRHLLQHTAGGWGNQTNDPMFLQSAMSADQLITWTLDNYALQRPPGTTYDYSNFGYCVLGRIVEKVTGKSYEDYVRDDVLKLAGVSTMAVAGSTFADRKPNEVKYYGTPAAGADPYAYNFPRLDAGGGWVASATDLARLLVHVDGFGMKKDILSADAINLMTTPPTLNEPSGYACGWSVRDNLWWHMGSLPGTVTEIVRNGDLGINAVILVNLRDGGQMVNDLDRLLWNSIVRNTSVQWQDIDQF